MRLAASETIRFFTPPMRPVPPGQKCRKPNVRKATKRDRRKITPAMGFIVLVFKKHARQKRNVFKSSGLFLVLCCNRLNSKRLQIPSYCETGAMPVYPFQTRNIKRR
jgi:hypothetical protein